MTDDQRVLRGLSRVAERQEIDGIKHIRLARSVVANEAVYFGRQSQCCLLDIFIVNDGKSF